MVRKSARLRLVDIDPEQLARDVGDQLASFVSHLAFKLAPRFMLHLQGPEEAPTDIGLTVQDLATYAIGRGGLDATVGEYCVSLIPLLGTPLDPSSGPLPLGLARWLEGETDTRNLDPESLADRVGLVITAALGREAIEGGHAVTAPQLAALASVSPDSVRRLVRTGEIKAPAANEIPAAEASRWLASRRPESPESSESN